MERYLLKIAVDKDEFPQRIQVEEECIKMYFEPTGFAYVQDDRVLVEYRIADMECNRLSRKKDN